MKFKVNNIPETYPRLSGETFAKDLCGKFILEHKELLENAYSKNKTIEIIFPPSLEKVAPSISKGFISALEYQFPRISKLLIFNGNDSVVKSFKDYCLHELKVRPQSKKIEFCKSSLHSGDLVELKNGWRCLYLENARVGDKNADVFVVAMDNHNDKLETHLYLENYNDDLSSIITSWLDVVKININDTSVDGIINLNKNNIDWAIKKEKI